jgi:hypothetical protein
MDKDKIRNTNHEELHHMGVISIAVLLTHRGQWDLNPAGKWVQLHLLLRNSYLVHIKFEYNLKHFLPSKLSAEQSRVGFGIVLLG